MKTFFLIILVAMSILALGNSHAHAVGAVVIQDEHCVVDGNTVGLPSGYMTRNTVMTQTPSGVVNAVCTFNIPKGSVEKDQMKKSGFACKVSSRTDGEVFTDDTRLVMTPGGKAVLTCKYKPE